MASLQSSLFIFALKYRHLLKFKLKRRNNIDWNTSIPELRRETGKSVGFLGKLPEGFSVSQVSISGLNAEWIIPPGALKDKAILYFHGGGYVIGSSLSHRPVVAKFAKGSGIGALVFDYGLAPEHPFPAALNDSVAAYLWMLEQDIAPSGIVFAGDSAGGGLCLATLLALRDQGIEMPAGAVALSPWTDLQNTGESLKSNVKVDALTWAESWTIFSKYYAGNNSPCMPWISPLYGDLNGLPPLLIFAGGDELLRDDSIRFAEKAKEAGVDVTLHVGEGMFHCYPACSPLFPEARQAMEEICEFIRTRVNLRQDAVK